MLGRPSGMVTMHPLTRSVTTSRGPVCGAVIGFHLVERCNDEAFRSTPCPHLGRSLFHNRGGGDVGYVAVGGLHTPPVSSALQNTQRGAHKRLGGHLSGMCATRAQTCSGKTHLCPAVGGIYSDTVGYVDACRGHTAYGFGTDTGFRCGSSQHNSTRG